MHTPISSPGACWYAVRTRCNHEKTTLHSLRARDILCFLPSYEALSTWKDRQVLLERPLFPGYIFIHLQAAEKLRVAVVPGVAQVLCDHPQYDAINPSIVALLQQRAATVNTAPHQYLSAGQQVTIIRGPFTGVEGVLMKNQTKARVVVSIPSIVRAFCVEVDSTDVRESCMLASPSIPQKGSLCGSC